MLTKGAFGNLVNRYRAVLKKCNLINTFGSLAVASMLVLGGAGVASAAVADGAIFYNKGTSITGNITGTGSETITFQGDSSDNSAFYGVNSAVEYSISNLSQLKLKGPWNPNASVEGEDIFWVNTGATLNISNIDSIVTTDDSNVGTMAFNTHKSTINISNVGKLDIRGVDNVFVAHNESSITVNADIVNISSVDYSAIYLSKSDLSITSKDITIAATNAKAIYAVSGSNVTLDGTASITGDVSVDSTSTLTLNLGGESTIDGALAASGDVTVNLNSGDASLTVDSSSGSITVSGSGAANDAVGGNADALMDKVQTADGSALANATFAGMEEGFLYGAVDDSGEAAKPNTAVADTLEVAHAAPLALGRVVMNDVRKRMGDLRDSKEESGVWMRWDGGKLAGSEGLTNNFNTIQIGGDKKFGKNCRFGVAGAFTHGDIDHTNGSGEMETFSFSAYGTWMGDNGMFADVIARVGFTNTDLTMKGNNISLDNEALSLSAEYGWRFDVCKQFYVEPQVELTYTYLTSADAKVSYADYSVDSLDSLIGRAGLLAGWKLPDDMGSVYARASVVQEFLGDSKLTASAFGNTIAHSVDGQDTWVEYGLGANVKLNDKTYIWADVERTAGADLDEEWRGTVGLRYSF